MTLKVLLLCALPLSTYGQGADKCTGTCKATASGIGVSGKDYFHFVKEGNGTNYASKEKVGKGVTLFKWNGTEEGINNMTMHYPAHNLIEWEAGSKTPYPSTNVTHDTDTIYFVAKGNVTITVYGNTTDTRSMGEGDTVWIKAGTKHSSIVPIKNTKGTMVTPLYKPYAPKAVHEVRHDRRLQPGPAPAPSPPSMLKGTHRFYLATDLALPDPSSRGVIHHYEWYAYPYDGTVFPFHDDVDILHVWWDIGAEIGCHSHFEGALYVPSWGQICFTGEWDGGESTGCRSAGEARWTRSGYNYDYERAGPNGTQIIVLNAHSGPLACPSESPFQLQV